MNNNKKPRKFNNKREKPEFDQKLLDLARVTRVVKGGRRFSFRATMVIGNRKGKVGVGVSKGSDVSDAVNKAVNDAKKNMIEVKTQGTTITHEIEEKLGSAKVMLKPAKKGRGIVAGGPIRTVVELAGIKDIVSKSFGSSNKLNVSRATISALSKLTEAKKSEKKTVAKKVAEKKNETKKATTKKVVSKKATTKKATIKKTSKK
ncbi:MAG: 30S ribosomal protein S5 [Candidatus Moranbacteria bacterium]|nr:30S ribosomal protein S5 [Candidatus Moranbacteria bacterium]